MNRFSKYLDFDWIAVVAVGFLLMTGLVAIYSLSLEVEREGFNNFQKQFLFLCFAIVVFLAFSWLDYRTWKSYGGILYLFGVFLLVAVLFWGVQIRGTSGWFSFGIFNLQPAELVKLFLIISLAKYFSQISASHLGLRHVLVSFVYVIIPVVLVAKQPDMGSALVMIVIWFGILFLAGLKKKYLFVLIMLAVVTFVFGWNIVLKDYQQQRIESFMNPGADPLGSGYNVIQSMVAVGSGGVSGKGLGHGSQSQLNFLPEKHTDFIFATIAEESGLVGASLVLGLLWLLLFRMKKTSDVSKDSFGRLLVGGVMIMIFFQVFINIGMNLGIMPIAGLSLPFLSYGGSFLIVTLAATGLTQSVWKRRVKRKISLEGSLGRI
ncbi:MAG: rod shape-determining protein RodA [Patescibacteria group bacterium]|nr:rod shape-determining protein RodA [Patescibacteria group bacterium]